MKMMTVHEVASLTGVSVRTLHHYDAVGLLRPASVTDAGYRLYGTDELRRLRMVLFFRELGFSLAEIGRIIDDPSFDQREALERQITLLEMKRERLGRMIALARDTLDKEEKGEDDMDFSAFDKNEIDAYAAEVRERWGSTDAYAQSRKRESGRSKDESEALAAEMMRIFAGFGALRGDDPAGDAAQAVAEKLRSFITANYYDCTKEIFASLGEMYVGDERFRENIDRSGGEGTAEFAAAAIRFYCGK